MKHIKKTVYAAALMLFASGSIAQAGITETDTAQHPVPDFALSFNPLGFVQFGPVLSGEFGLDQSTLINVHLRFAKAGVLSWVIRDDPDEMDAFAYGAGLVRFFGYNYNRPYAGFFIERETSTSVYEKGYLGEWTQENKTMVYVFNVGYRFNFQDGFFLNTGTFFGASTTNYEWEYKYPDQILDYEPRSGDELTGFFMLEVTLGYAF